MRQGMSAVIAVHWAALFGLLAFLCTADPAVGPANVLAAFGLADDAPVCSVKVGAVFATASALAASLFLWMLAGCILGRPEEAGPPGGDHGREAFAGGVLVLVLLSVTSVLVLPASGALALGEAMIAAVLLSYLVVCAERLLVRLGAEVREASPARSMAFDAARETLLWQDWTQAGLLPRGRI